jgi:hypothetical protein
MHSTLTALTGLVLSLVSCGPVDTDTVYPSPPDTSTPSTDTGGSTDLTFSFSTDAESNELQLYNVKMVQEGFDIDEIAAATAVVTDETFTLSMPEPDSSAFAEFDSNHPGLEIAMYLPALHDGDVFTGVGMHWLAYAQGDIPKEYASFGVVAGWNVFVFSYSVDSNPSMALGSIEAIFVESNLISVDEITVGGIYSGDSNPEDLRLTALPLMLLKSGETDFTPVADEALGEPWSLTLSGSPDDDHFTLDEVAGAETALEVPSAYFDLDGDESFDLSSDPVDGYSCTLGGQTVALSYTSSFDDLLSALYWISSGWNVGWTAVQLESSGPGDPGTPSPISEKEMMSLLIGSTCGCEKGCEGGRR